MEKHNNSPYIRRATVCTLSAMLVGCVIAPQNGRNTPTVGAPSAEIKPIDKTAFSGVPEKLGDFSELNADCTSAGRPTIVITQAASHGSVAIQNDAESYSNFPSTNQRYECNKKKSPSVGVVYTSEKSFVGTDRFKVKRVSHWGDVLTQEYVVTVEQLHGAQASTVPP
jgi:hypothetical protein